MQIIKLLFKKNIIKAKCTYMYNSKAQQQNKTEKELPTFSMSITNILVLC